MTPEASDRNGGGLAARLTPPGVGGIHVFAIEGDGVETFLSRHFESSRDDRPARSLTFGSLVDADEIIDEALVHRHGGDLPRADISVHGGRAVERRMTGLLEESGFEVVTGAWSSRSNGVSSGLRAEADRALQKAFAVHAVLFLLSVGEGALEREIKSLVDALEPSAASQSPRHVAIESRIATLLDRAPFGRAMIEPPVVVITGPVNVGKSTLFNRLVGADRTIVSSKPGTTRDAVEVAVEIDGYPFRIIDTAGIRADGGPIEKLGIERAKKLSESADIRLELESGDELEAGTRTREDHRVIPIVTKIDRVGPEAKARIAERRPEALLVSSTTGEGFERLASRVVYTSVFAGPAVREFPCPFTARQVSCLQEAMHHLPQDPSRARRLLDRVLTGDDAQGNLGNEEME